MSARRLSLAIAAVAALAVGLGAAPGLADTGSHGAQGGSQAVVEWNATALRTTAAAPFDPPLESRNLALVQVAVFDAVVAIRDSHRASAVAAAATAADRALLALYPAQAAALDQAYQASLAEVPDGAAKLRGVAVGQRAAQALLAIRASDHSGDVVAFTPGSGPGAWVPTPPAFRPALDPGWGRVTPYLLRAGAQFRPGPPPALTSATYARDFDEIRQAGSATSMTRTPEQTNWRASGSRSRRRSGTRRPSSSRSHTAWASGRRRGCSRCSTRRAPTRSSPHGTRSSPTASGVRSPRSRPRPIRRGRRSS